MGAELLISLLLQAVPPLLAGISKIIHALLADPETPEELKQHLTKLQNELAIVAQRVVDTPLIPPGSGR